MDGGNHRHCCPAKTTQWQVLCHHVQKPPSQAAKTTYSHRCARVRTHAHTPGCQTDSTHKHTRLSVCMLSRLRVEFHNLRLRRRWPTADEVMTSEAIGALNALETMDAADARGGITEDEREEREGKVERGRGRKRNVSGDITPTASGSASPMIISRVPSAASASSTVSTCAWPTASAWRWSAPTAPARPP